MELLGFVVLVGIVLPLLLRWLPLLGLPTLEQYLGRHPEAKGRGGIKCIHCESRNQYIWWAFGPKVGFGPKKHVCRSCGRALYRT